MPRATAKCRRSVLIDAADRGDGAAVKRLATVVPRGAVSAQAVMSAVKELHAADNHVNLAVPVLALESESDAGTDEEEEEE